MLDIQPGTRRPRSTRSTRCGGGSPSPTSTSRSTRSGTSARDGVPGQTTGRITAARDQRAPRCGSTGSSGERPAAEGAGRPSVHERMVKHRGADQAAAPASRSTLNFDGIGSAAAKEAGYVEPRRPRASSTASRSSTTLDARVMRPRSVLGLLPDGRLPPVPVSLLGSSGSPSHLARAACSSSRWPPAFLLRGAASSGWRSARRRRRCWSCSPPAPRPTSRSRSPSPAPGVPGGLLVLASTAIEDPRDGRPRRRDGRSLARAGGRRGVLVLSPARSSRLDRWADDLERARFESQRVLTVSVATLAAAGIEAEGRVGDGDPLQAAEDTLRSYAATEVVVVATGRGVRARAGRAGPPSRSPGPAGPGGLRRRRCARPRART